MGYYISLTDTDVRIPADQLDAALAEMKRINGPEFDSLKTGGSYGPEGKVAVWYSWMPESFDGYESLSDFLTDVGFDHEERHGDIWLTAYDNKHGAQDIFLDFLAPFIPDGCFMDWQGEDGERWRFTFEDGCIVEWGEVVSWRRGEMTPVKRASQFAHLGVN